MIADLIAEHNQSPHERILQRRLAKEITVMVHSQEDYDTAVEASEILFGKSTSETLRKIDEETLLSVFEGVPQFEIDSALITEQTKLVDLFVDNAPIFSSKGELRKLVKNGGISLNKEKVEDCDQLISDKDLLNNKYLLVQKGKKNYYLVLVK